MRVQYVHVFVILRPKRGECAALPVRMRKDEVSGQAANAAQL